MKTKIKILTYQFITVYSCILQTDVLKKPNN